MPHILHIHTQHCACGAVETLSRLYMAEEVNGYTHGRPQKLLPCTSIAPTDAVHRLELPVKQVPVCTACSRDFAGVGAEAWARWQDTLRRKAEAARATAPTSTASRKTATIEDLI